MTATATVQCTEVMRDHLTGDRSSAQERRIFSHPATHWRSASWQVGVFVAGTRDGTAVIGLGLVNPGRRVGDYERGLSVDAVTAIAPPLPTATLATALGEYEDTLNANGPLTDARGRRLRDAIVGLRPDLADVMEYLSRRLNTQIRGARGELLSWQKDGLGVLLEAAGVPRDALREWLPPADEPRSRFSEPEPPLTPFLVGMPNEAQMLAHDMHHFQNWESRPGREVGVRYFTHGDQSLWVYMSNTRRSETELGMDLFYYHENHQSFVLIQYKRMIQLHESRWGYRPDSHINDQLDQLRAIDKQCASDPVTGLRLVHTPSMVKLCQADPVSSATANLIKGMYLTRQHFEELLATCTGERGGTLLTYDNVPRYMNNTMFTELLKDGWIGTAGTGTKYVKELIEAAESTDRAVTVGVHSSPTMPGNRASRRLRR